jgi:hypothetical protein
MDNGQLAIAIIIVSIATYWAGVWIKSHLLQRLPVVSPIKNGLIMVGQGLYFIGLPYLLLIGGFVPARLFGLRGVENVADPGLGQPALARIAGILAQAGNFLLSSVSDFGPFLTIGLVLGAAYTLLCFFFFRTTSPAEKSDGLLVYPSKLGILFDGVHWSLYRAAIWLATGSLYFGGIGGILLIAIEYSIANWLGRFRPLEQRQYLLRFAIGLVAASLFLFAPNLWLNLIFYLALVIITEGLFKVSLKAELTTHTS